ncbi:hypothetical protein JW756_01960 [Candidatus Woesearchaeota archaeon]|nr:hypothetical protein [Candidatus Woesearchaeota archaeon]
MPTNLNRDAVLKIVQTKGPVIPNDIRKELGGENLIIGAILSELAGDGKVKVTFTKIGGTPAYYYPGTESRLQNLIKHLNEKDRQTALYLQQKKVLKDSELTPLLRVSLRNIRDFAKPLEVSVKGQKEIYWKWYLTPTEEAEKIIFKQVKPVQRAEAQTPEPAPIIKKEEKIEAPKPAAEAKKESGKPEVVKEKEKPKEKKEKEDKPVEVQKQISIPSEHLEHEKDTFFKKILEYFNANDIQVIEYKIIRKKSDIELTIAVPSRIGSQEYYCKAKSKTKVNDGDLSTVYIQGQAKKLPVIFITTGELTKKAKEMLAKDFKGMIVKRI